MADECTASSIEGVQTCAAAPPHTAHSWTQFSVTNAVILVLITYPIIRALYNLTIHPLAKIPGPKTWGASRIPFIRSLLRGTIVHDFEKLHRRYGPILRIAPDEVTFAHPDAWDDIFVAHPGRPQFLKDPTWWARGPGEPNSLISAIDVDEHAGIRKMLSPGFTPRALRQQEPFVQRYVNLLIDRLRGVVASGDDPSSTDKKRGVHWETGVEVDMTPWFNFTTFDIFGDLGFGESFECLENSRYHPWIALLFNSVKAASFVSAARFYPVLIFVLTKIIPPSLKKMARKHYLQIAEKVDRRMNYELERPDIMSHVIAQGDKKEGLSDGVIKATFQVLTTAGSETTATALSGTLNYLINEPEKLKELVKEIRGRFGSAEEITIDSVRGCEYLNACLHEGLRLCPPIPWVLPRLVPKGGATVCGVWLPEGTRVSIQAWTMNRDPELFHEAETFVPERWLSSVVDDKESPFHGDQRECVQPFSVGPRNCMGQHLAWAEMRLVLAKMLWTFDVAAPVEKEKRLRWEDLRTFLLVEKKPVLVRMKVREGIPQ